MAAWLLCVGTPLWTGPSPAEGLPPAGGQVQLTVRPADVVKEAFLLERTSTVKYPLARATSHPLEGTSAQSAAEGPARSGGAPQAPASAAAYFAATGLPPGSYDLVLLTARGRLEGVDLKTPNAAPPGRTQRRRGEAQVGEAPIDSSARVSASALPGAEAGGPAEKAGRPALSAKDVESIRKLVLGMTSFADRRRILFLEGSGTEARVLVEELTTRKTSLPSPVPFVVWRVEVWSYRKEFGAWDRYDSRFVARERLPVTEFEQTTWVFEPALGGLQVSEATAVVEVAYEVPQEFDPARGLVAGKPFDTLTAPTAEVGQGPEPVEGQKLPGDKESR